MFKPISARRLLLASATATLLLAASAQAGFEWKGPLTPPAANTPAVPTDAFPAPVTEGNASANQTVDVTNIMPAEKVAPVELAPVVATPMDVMAQPEPVVEGDVVDGFGADLPLAIALQQIVPPGYQYSFGVGINPGTSVTWEGGKPWKKVLDETLAAKGLSYVIDNNVVKITERSASAAPVAVSSLPNVSGIETLRTDSNIASANGPAVTTSAADPITIHRQKPSLLARMKTMVMPKPAEAETEPVNIAVPTQPQPLVQSPPSPPAPMDDTTAKSGMTESEITWSAAPSMEPMSITRDAVMPPPAETIAPPPPVTSGISLSTDTAAANAAAPPALASATWHGARGQTLREVLKNWSDVAGVELYWSIDYDYRLQQDAAYPGTYDEAVGKILDQFATIRPQPYGQLHQSEAPGSRVLVIKSYDTAL